MWRPGMRYTSATTCTATSSGHGKTGLTTVMFDSDQGRKAYLDCAPDYTITDLHQLLGILGNRRNASHPERWTSW